MVIFNIQVLRLLWKKRNGFKQFLINIWFQFDSSFKKAIQTNDDDDDDDDDNNAFLKVREKTSEEKVKILFAQHVKSFALFLPKWLSLHTVFLEMSTAEGPKSGDSVLH